MRAAASACASSTRPCRADTPVRLAKRSSNLFRLARGLRRTRARRRRVRRRALGRSRGARRRGPGHDHLRASRRGHAAPRPHAAGRSAAAHDHPRRRGHRPRHRVGLVSQRAPARVGSRDGGHDRRRAHRRGAPRQRARRPLQGLPELLRDAGLRAAPAHRARAGAPLRPPAPHPLRGSRRLLRRRGRGRRHPLLGGRARRLHGRDRVRPGSALPDPRDDGRHGPRDVRLHRRGDLLPLDPAPPRGPPHDPRLPVALGHRLVLVLEVVRSPAPANPQAVAEALPAQRRLLEDHRLRAPPRDHRPDQPPTRPSRPRGRDPGHRGPDRPRGGVPRRIPARGRDRPGLDVPAAASRGVADVAALPAGARRPPT